MRKIFFKVYIYIIILGLFSGCSIKEPEVIKLVFPSPPNEAKIFFETSYRGDIDFVKSSAVDLFIGEKISIAKINLAKPYGVAAMGDNIYVADTAMGVVVNINEKLKKVSLIGDGSSGKLALPISVAIDDNNNIYVTDAKNASVMVYDKNGKLIKAIGGRLEFVKPTGVAVNSKEKIVYIVDTKAHNVKAYSLDGNLLFTFGKRGIEESEFNFPTNVAIDRRNGNVVIVDTQNFRVQVFDKDGKFIRKFGKIGDRAGMFARPKGVGIDSDGNIYITDAAFNNIQVFNDKGELLIFFGSAGKNIGQFTLITGIYIDKYDRIYIVDSFNARVQIFQYMSESWKKKNPKKYEEIISI